MLGHDLPDELDQFLAAREHELIAFRRDLHAHPELGYHEHRTTSRVALRLAAAGQENVLVPLRAVLAAQATVGEVCDALRDVWGTYRPPDIS